MTVTAYSKPKIAISEVEGVLKAHLESIATEIKPMEGGNLSSVFSYQYGGAGHVIKFSELEGAYATERFISELLSSQGIPYPKCTALGSHGELSYIIMERMDGHNLADCTPEQQAAQLPELIGILARLNHADIGTTSGYGWIGPDGKGQFSTWKEYLAASFAEDQSGTFWENWHDLFHSTCLEKDVFDECYSRLMAYAPYNEPHRHFIHGDFHQWNILSSGTRITGIIDGNCAYGDYLVDLAILDRHMERLGVVRAYLDHQEQAGLTIPNFKERLLGAYYMKGLDGLRFYAKMGWTDAYNGTRDFLLKLET